MADEEHAPHYEVTPLQCHACRAREERAAVFTEQKVAPAAGIYFPVSKDSDLT